MTIVPDPAALAQTTARVIGRTAQELRDATPVRPDWLIPTFLARQQITELNGREKIGKGWFEAYLMGRLEQGVPSLFHDGETVVPTRTLIYTEEPDHPLRQKFDAFDVSESFVVPQWELAGQPWDRTIAWLVDKALEIEAGLLFIDNISSATRTEDENGVELARKVEPLARRAKEHKLAVLYDRHQRKSAGKVEDLSRGSTALAGAVDQIVSMSKGPGRERRLDSWGRLWEANWVRTVELTEDHDDYLDLGDGDWKAEKLQERQHWTVKELAEALGHSDEAARQYLEASVLAHKRREKQGNAYVYDIIEPPELN